MFFCRCKQPLMPAARKDFLPQFYSQTVDVLQDLRRYMYRCISRRLANVRPHAPPPRWPCPGT